MDCWKLLKITILLKFNSLFSSTNWKMLLHFIETFSEVLLTEMKLSNSSIDYFFYSLFYMSDITFVCKLYFWCKIVKYWFIFLKLGFINYVHCLKFSLIFPSQLISHCLVPIKFFDYASWQISFNFVFSLNLFLDKKFIHIASFEKFKKKSVFRNYLIYFVALIKITQNSLV